MIRALRYDEHGGFYDHVAPPQVGVPSPDGICTKEGFSYTRLGVRIPTIAVSPWIAKGTLVHDPPDAQKPAATCVCAYASLSVCALWCCALVVHVWRFGASCTLVVRWCLGRCAALSGRLNAITRAWCAPCASICVCPPRPRLDSSAYELTSIPATLRKIFPQLGGPLTQRDAWAATFEHLISDTLRSDADCPTQLPDVRACVRV